MPIAPHGPVTPARHRSEAFDYVFGKRGLGGAAQELVSPITQFVKHPGVRTGIGLAAVVPVGKLGATRESLSLSRHAGRDLEGLPGPVEVPGKGPVHFRSVKVAQETAERYMHKAGLHFDPPKRYAKVEPHIATQIAKEFDAMKHDPHHPEVKASYEALAKETLAQYKAIRESGQKFTFMPEGLDLYAASPRMMHLDVVKNKHMAVFPTEGGFGALSGTAIRQSVENPLLRPVPGVKWGGKTVLYNDLFRAVHDYFGHVKEGNGFRADGEENAWRSHSAMYSPKARRAMTTETRGQNSWVNYGPHGEHNRTARTSDTVFADQKVGLLPDWVTHLGSH